jgi:hypothetical protein
MPISKCVNHTTLYIFYVTYINKTISIFTKLFLPAIELKS